MPAVGLWFVQVNNRITDRNVSGLSPANVPEEAYSICGAYYGCRCKGAPSITFTTTVYQDVAKNMSDLRSMNMFTVKGA